MANASNEMEALRKERDELRAALVTMCDTYSSNRSEKLRVKAYRFVAAKGAGPFSLAAVEAELAKIEDREREELERCREALREVLNMVESGQPHKRRDGSWMSAEELDSRIAELRAKFLGGK